jgi:hypothetical protein
MSQLKCKTTAIRKMKEMRIRRMMVISQLEAKKE